MKIQILDSSIGDGPRLQILSSMLINDEIAIDAGSIGFASPFSVQRRIKHVFITHSHIDHICSLPVFLDNVYEPTHECPMIYASQSVFDSLQSDFFNDRVWPDLLRLSREETPFLKMQTIENLSTVSVNGVRITPVSLHHTVPVFGFIIENESSAVAIICDTSPTEQVWKELNRRPKLKGLFLEASFPNSMDWLAQKAMHLTPALFARELDKLDADVRTMVIHVKPAFNDRIMAEIEELKIPRVEVAQAGQTYNF